jgi:hypothetical protein
MSATTEVKLERAERRGGKAQRGRQEEKTRDIHEKRARGIL